MADLTFRFGETGADKLASGMRKVSDTSVLAAKGARLCADALEKQRKASDVSAGASLALAKADKILEEAEHGLADGALEAELALRGEADAASKAAREADKARASFTGLGGVGKAGLFAGLAGGAAALSVPLIAAGTAVAGFGALAAPTLDKVKDALTQTGAAGTKAWAALDPAQRSIAKDLKSLEGQFGQMAKAFEPVVASVVGGGAKLAAAFLPSLAPLAKAGAEVITAIVTPLTSLVKSGLFGQFTVQLSQVAVAAGKLLGPLLVTALKTFIQLFDSLAPAGLQVLAAMQPLVTVLGTALSQILPPLGKAFANIVTAVLPLVPAVTAVAAGLATVVAAVPPAVLTKVAEAFLVIVGAVKAWSIAQAALDVLLNANPVGLIVTALAAAAAGFTVAWKKSSDFRDVIKTVGSAAVQTAVLVLESVKTIGDGILNALKFIIHESANVAGLLHLPFAGALKAMDQDLGGFRSGFDKSFTGMIGTLRGWQGELGASKRTSDTTTAAIVANFKGQGAAANIGRDDVVAYTNAVKANGSGSDAARSARSRLITDLKNSGVSARNAEGLVNNLQASISRLKGKTVTVGANATASGTISIVGAGWAAGQGNIRFHAARGAYVSTGSSPTADDNLARVSKGELIVPAHMVQAGAVNHLRGRIPGFASGGFTGVESSLAGITPAASSFTGGDAKKAVTAGVAEAMAKAKAAAAAKELALIRSVSTATGALGGPTSASAAQAQAYARSRLGAYGWGAVQMNPLISLWNQESGWNRLARNPSSGAYGIPQALPASKMGAAANPPTSSAAAQINWGLSYIKGRYGSPAGAWGHEVGFNWYDKGGWLKPGLTLAVNNTGRPEQVIPPGGSSGGGGVNMTVVLENRGVIGSEQQLADWLVRQMNKLAQHGRLTQAVRAANR